MHAILVIILLLGPVACSQDTRDLCLGTSASLTAALDSAAPGETVRVCAGARIEGAFSMPGGVTLEGGGTGTLVGRGGAVVTIEPGTENAPSVVRGVRLEVRAEGSGTPAGIVASGPGRVVLESIHIELGAGIGVVLSGTTEVVVDGVEIEGDPDPGLARRSRIAATEAPVAGLVVENPGEGWCSLIAIARLSVRGVVGVGASLEQPCPGSTAELVAVRDIIGSGLLVVGGTIAVQDLLVSGVRGRDVVASDAVSYAVALHDGADVSLTTAAIVDVSDAAIAAAGAALVADGVAVLGVRGPGLLISDGVVRLDGAIVRGTLDAGIVLRASEAELNAIWVGDIQAAAVMDAMARIAWSGDGIRVFGAEGQAASMQVARATVSVPARAGLVGAAAASIGGDGGALVVCDDVPTQEAWSCSSDETGVENCTRAVPPIAPGWDCGWEAGALACSGGTGDDIPRAEEAEARPDAACGGALRELLVHPAMASLVAGSGLRLDALSPRGIIGEDGTLGFREAGMDVGDIRPRTESPWRCTDSGNGRICRLPDTADRSAPSSLHPGGLDPSSWRCITDAAARICTRFTIAAGLLEEATTSPDLVSPQGEFLGQRTARAAIATPNLSFGRSAPVMPAVPADGLVGLGGALRGVSSSPVGLEVSP